MQPAYDSCSFSTKRAAISNETNSRHCDGSLRFVKAYVISALWLHLAQRHGHEIHCFCAPPSELSGKHSSRIATKRNVMNEFHEKVHFPCPSPIGWTTRICEVTGLRAFPCPLGGHARSETLAGSRRSRTQYACIYSFVSSASPARAFLLFCILSCLLSRAALVFARLASISSLRILSRCFSALAL